MRFGMVDPGEAVAIGLGVVAVVIAAWAELRDKFFYLRRDGPVELKLTEFKIPFPAPSKLGDSPAVYYGGHDGVVVEIQYEMWNRVSWPVYASMSAETTITTQALVTEYVRAGFEHDGRLLFFVPPRQPFSCTLCVVIARDRPSRVTPTVVIHGRQPKFVRGPTKAVEWDNGTARLTDRLDIERFYKPEVTPPAVA
jgi:hypothetical protein